MGKFFDVFKRNEKVFAAGQRCGKANLDLGLKEHFDQKLVIIRTCNTDRFGFILQLKYVIFRNPPLFTGSTHTILCTVLQHFSSIFSDWLDTR